MDALGVRLNDPGLDDEELDTLAKRLRAELLDLDVEDVVPFHGEGDIPDGAKGIEFTVIGSLLVKLISKVDVAKVVSALKDWLLRQHLHSIEVTVDGDTLKLTNITSEEQDRLVELWVSRHAKPD
ncbi:hypothetical protein QF038_000847 [Pseudarthrobacter sp. W1I19]|uniref:hypothetical protein n=1 Tax=Pseudarthrobacter sp. W1I19 TaxID=3042288 RepID=UPI002788B10A|nr:hypothetical protein [Pseudarthrobacter sp. W1I19]MDQ0922339.1 hypothetical protein [Pseudarthrobacter sp. W1I19]